MVWTRKKVPRYGEECWIRLRDRWGYWRFRTWWSKGFLMVSATFQMFGDVARIERWHNVGKIWLSSDTNNCCWKKLRCCNCRRFWGKGWGEEWKIGRTWPAPDWTVNWVVQERMEEGVDAFAEQHSSYAQCLQHFAQERLRNESLEEKLKSTQLRHAAELKNLKDWKNPKSSWRGTLSKRFLSDFEIFADSSSLKQLVVSTRSGADE